MITQTKRLIETTVREYITFAPDEYENFKKGKQVKVNMNANKFAEMEGSDYLIRELYEMPETLHSMLKLRLSDEQYKWFRTSAGGIWFAKTFKDFRSAKLV